MLPDRDDHGVRPEARDRLGALLDTPMNDDAPVHLRRSGRVRRDAPSCGADSQRMTDATDAVTCRACKLEAAERDERDERRILRAISAGHGGGQHLSRLPKGDILAMKHARWRLETKGEAVVYGGALYITDLGKKRLEAGK